MADDEVATILTYPASLIIARPAIMATMRAVMRKLKLHKDRHIQVNKFLHQKLYGLHMAMVPHMEPHDGTAQKWYHLTSKRENGLQLVRVNDLLALPGAAFNQI